MSKKIEIIERMKNNHHRSFVYLEEDEDFIILKGDLSGHAALRFVKVLITEYPVVQHMLKGWKPEL